LVDGITEAETGNSPDSVGSPDKESADELEPFTDFDKAAEDENSTEASFVLESEGHEEIDAFRDSDNKTDCKSMLDIEYCGELEYRIDGSKPAEAPSTNGVEKGTGWEPRIALDCK
jgi:hypothetical protein